MRTELSTRELEVIAAWWHVGSVKGAAEILCIAEQTAKNDLWTARMRSGAPTTLALAQMYAGRLPSLRTLRQRAQKQHHNKPMCVSFAEVAVDKPTHLSVLGRSSKRYQNYYFAKLSSLRTLVRERDCGRLGPVLHHVAHNTIERPVQSSKRRTQPRDLHGHRPPALLEALPLPVIDWLGQVEYEAVTEREPRPHVGTLLQVAS